MKLIKSSKYYINRENNSTRTVLPDNLKEYDWILINSHEL